MKRIVKDTNVFVLVLTMIVASSVCSQENEWGVEIELAQQRYILHQPIVLDVVVTNRTSDTLRTHPLSAANSGPLAIELYDEDGDLVRYTGPVFHLAGGPGRLLLDAGEQEYGCFDLTRLFASRDKFSGYRVEFDCFPAIPLGAYTVRVVFEDVVSNVLTFKVVQPSSDEDVVLHLIEDAFAVLAGCRSDDIDKRDLSSQKYKDIVERFPNSVFAETCYHMFRVDSRERQSALRQGSRYDDGAITREMLEKYPNSCDARSWLLSIARETDLNSTQDLLNHILKDKPKTRASKYARLMLSRLEKLKAGE